MKVYWSHSDYDGALSGALTMGTFDGFHLGHQKIVQTLVSYSHKVQCPSILLTFDPHPLELIKPELGIKRLFPLENMMRSAESLNVDYFIVENFSKDFSQLTAEFFFEQYIYQTFQPSCLVVGYDFRFGFDREGGIQKLKIWKDQYQFEIQEVSPVRWNGQIISSSLLRKAFKELNFLQLHQFMGHPFSIKGKVISGEARGGKLGFPTANLKTSSLLPQRGVYIGQVQMDQKVIPAVMNIGVHPTFAPSFHGLAQENQSPVKVEVHLIDFYPGSLKGQTIEVDVLSYIRDEQKFENVHQLKKEILSDIKKAKTYFSNI